MPSKMAEMDNKLDLLLSLMNQPKEEADRKINVSEVREMIPGKPARQTIYQYVWSKRIPKPEKHGKDLYWSKLAIQEWLDAGRPHCDPALRLKRKCKSKY